MTERGVRPSWNLLDPKNPLSPLHREHPWRWPAPARSTARARRRPPLLPLPESDGAVSALLYGRGGRFDALPFPNMEWWWNTIEFTARDGAGYFLLTNVHSFGTPSRVPDTRGTVALFEVRSGRRHSLRSAGTVLGDPSCKYEAPGWLLQRLVRGAPGEAVDHGRAARLLDVSAAELGSRSSNGCYVIAIESHALRVRLHLEQHQSALYGDRADEPGWYDNNPSGAAPIWASYRSRFQTPRGYLELGPPGHARRVDVAQGHARFDHQSLHWSVEDNGPPSPAALLEQSLSRPKWAWYHARVDGCLNIMGYQIWNANTRVVTKLAAAVANELSGAVVAADVSSIKLSVPRTVGALAAPVNAVLSFDIRRGAGGVPAGHYELCFRYDPAIDWSVEYAAGPAHVYDAQEAYCTLSGRTPLGPVTGTGTQEVLDLGRKRRV